MKSPIKIVILTPGFSADEEDTTAIPSLQMYTRHLRAHYPDIDIQIISFQYPFRSGSYSWNGLPVYSAGGKNSKSFRIYTWIQVLAHLCMLRMTKGIDVVHAFWLTEATLLGLLFSRLTGTKFLATSMGQDVKKENRYLRILRHFKFNMTVISPFQQTYLSWYKNASIVGVIPFGVERSYFRDYQWPRNIDILGVGSLNSVKNYGEFIVIIESLKTTFPLITCRIIGEGIKRAEIEKMITEKGLGQNIVLAGNLPYSKTIEEMHKGKLLLHTSTFEGQALVITEALAAGLFVISHPVGIAASLRSKKLLTGITPEELAHYAQSILLNPEIDHTPEYPFTIEDTCSDYYDLYTGFAHRVEKMDK